MLDFTASFMRTSQAELFSPWASTPSMDVCGEEIRLLHELWRHPSVEEIKDRKKTLQYRHLAPPVGRHGMTQPDEGDRENLRVQSNRLQIGTDSVISLGRTWNGALILGTWDLLWVVSLMLHDVPIEVTRCQTADCKLSFFVSFSRMWLRSLFGQIVPERMWVIRRSGHTQSFPCKDVPLGKNIRAFELHLKLGDQPPKSFKKDRCSPY